MSGLIDACERGRVPECMMRYGMRRLLAERLRHETSGGRRRQQVVRETFRQSPVAVDTDAANDQHYALPPEFFRYALGARLKYSCCLWSSEVSTLEEAEEAALLQVAERAQIEDGMRILELGCGWGSFSLWAAERFPKSTLMAISNSASQREYILGRAQVLGLKNLEVRTVDINEFHAERSFDRIVSIEMLEHVRNHERLFERIAHWLEDDGRFFVHVFSHRDFAYPFETDGDRDWMARYFFTGGIMPSHALFKSYDQHLEAEDDWTLNGMHYQKTLDAWLCRMESRREDVRRVFKDCYGNRDAERWYHRWRMFFMACSELFGYNHGREWGVSHYRFKKS